MKPIKYTRIQEKLIDLKQGKILLLIIMHFFIQAVHFFFLRLIVVIAEENSLECDKVILLK